MIPLEVRLRDLPHVEVRGVGRQTLVTVGAWTIDPVDEPDAVEAWENAKAWAAYAIWLKSRK